MLEAREAPPVETDQLPLIDRAAAAPSSPLHRRRPVSPAVRGVDEAAARDQALLFTANGLAG